MARTKTPASQDSVCVRCSLIRRDTRRDGILCDAPDGRHVWIKRVEFTENVVAYVEDALLMGHGTNEILQRFGIQYESLVKRLRGSEVKAKFQSLRQQEWAERLSSRY